MKLSARFRLFLAVCFLPALTACAQPTPATVLPAAEILPAASAYGSARVIRNIPYLARPTARQNFDLYLPENPGSRPFPLVMWIHGGAWMSGFKDWNNVKYLVRHGYALASVDYRFSTEARFPAQIQDCNAAMNFILAHATNFGIDPRRFVVAGGSAGGHLALLLGFARTNTEFGADPAVKPLAILDFFGPTDFNHMLDDLTTIHSDSGLHLLHDAGPKLLGEPVDQPSERAKNASPITYVSAANPPVLILQGGRDELVPVRQSQRLKSALDQAGVRNQLILIDAASHDGPLFGTPEVEVSVVDFLNEIVSK